jgi:DNA (cytosine-5)-methyltransferase 1
MRPYQPTAIDLFCGCGGISCGLEDAGFNILAGVDINAAYLISFRHNFGAERALEMDLSAVSPDRFMALVGIRPGDLDLLAGGPPCQGFSKNVPRRQREADSANNRLVRTYLDYCEALRPRMLLMENVAEMKNGFEQTYTGEILERLAAIGYRVASVVLNAADYGVPQRRRRAFFLATRLGEPIALPPPTHFAEREAGTFFPRPGHVTVWEAIGDLPSIKPGEEASEYATEPRNDFQRFVRHAAQKLTNHRARILRPTQLARLSALKPGEGIKQLPPALRPKSGYSGAYGRLTRDMVAPTITRWVFHPGSGRFGHPVDKRVISIREAARLQGFPDRFEFAGTYLQQAGQVGNAVPPLLARQIGRVLIEHLQDNLEKKSFQDSFSEEAGMEKAMA